MVYVHIYLAFAQVVFALFGRRRYDNFWPSDVTTTSQKWSIRATNVIRIKFSTVHIFPSHLTTAVEELIGTADSGGRV